MRMLIQQSAIRVETQSMRAKVGCWYLIFARLLERISGKVRCAYCLTHYDRQGLQYILS